MNNQELNTALYEKLFAEQEKFKGWLLTQPPSEILNHAYEYVMREDIVLAMEYHDLTDEQAKALLASPSPLDEIFHDFENIEGDHMDLISGCIETRAAFLCILSLQLSQKSTASLKPTGHLIVRM